MSTSIIYYFHGSHDYLFLLIYVNLDGIHLHLHYPVWVGKLRSLTYLWEHTVGQLLEVSEALSWWLALFTQGDVFCRLVNFKHPDHLYDFPFVTYMIMDFLLCSALLYMISRLVIYNSLCQLLRQPSKHPKQGLHLIGCSYCSAKKILPSCFDFEIDVI